MIKKKRVVKKASYLIKWCEDHGYRYTYEGYVHESLPNLYFGLLEFCGRKPSNFLNYHEDWLE